MTDADLIAKKLAVVRTCCRELRELARIERIRSDVRERRFIEHTLQVAIQAVLDVASHIVSDERLGEPDTNRELCGPQLATGACGRGPRSPSQAPRRAFSAPQARGPAGFFLGPWRGPAAEGGAPGLPQQGVGGNLDAVSSSLLDEIRKLSLAERIQLVEDVWDSIAVEAEEFPIPDSHRERLARRREEHRRSPEDVVPWEEVRRQLWAEE